MDSAEVGKYIESVAVRLDFTMEVPWLEQESFIRFKPKIGQ